MKYLTVILILLSLSVTALAKVPSQASSVDCMKWVLKQFPQINERATYVPEHNLLIEKIAPGKVIHSASASGASLDEKARMICSPAPKVFEGAQLEGIQGLISHAINTKTKYLDVNIEGNSLRKTTAAIKFMQAMPNSCYWSHYRNVRSVVDYHCNYLKETAGSWTRVMSTISVCQETGR